MRGNDKNGELVVWFLSQESENPTVGILSLKPLRSLSRLYCKMLWIKVISLKINKIKQKIIKITNK